MFTNHCALQNLSTIMIRKYEARDLRVAQDISANNTIDNNPATRRSVVKKNDLELQPITASLPDHHPIRVVVLVGYHRRRISNSRRRETRLFPAQLSSRISLSPSRRKRPAVIRAKESAQGPPPLPRTCQTRDSASTMHRYTRKLQFHRDKTVHRPLVRVAHLFVHHLVALPLSAARIDTSQTRPWESTIDTRCTEESAICQRTPRQEIGDPTSQRY